jgi:hypothetical protein
MKKNSLMTYLTIYLLVLICVLQGCGTKQSSSVSVLVVLNDVQRKISADYFDEKILSGSGLTNAEKKYLKSAYSKEKDDYILSVILTEKISSGRATTHEDEILRIMRKIGTVPVYAKPSDVEPAFTVSEWKDGECAEKANPVKEIVRLAGNKEEALEWQKVTIGKDPGWVAGRNLLFKNTDETEGIILRDLDLFKIPVYSFANKLGRYERGMKVKSVGFSCPERIYGNTYINVEIYEKKGWCAAASIILNARAGIMMRDETLFNNPEDLKSNRNSNFSYSALDLVPVLEVRKDGWVKVAMDTNDKFYFIKNGKEAISDDPIDIAFASYVKDDYRRSRSIVKELVKAITSEDKLQAMLNIPDIREKLATLDLARAKIEGYLDIDEYKNSAFVRSGSPFSLGIYTQELFELVNEAEYILSSHTEEQKIESKKGMVPVDQPDESR